MITDPTLQAIEAHAQAIVDLAPSLGEKIRSLADHFRRLGPEVSPAVRASMLTSLVDAYNSLTALHGVFDNALQAVADYDARESQPHFPLPSQN